MSVKHQRAEAKIGNEARDLTKFGKSRRKFLVTSFKAAGFVALAPLVSRLAMLAQEKTVPKLQQLTVEIQPEKNIYLRNYYAEYGKQILSIYDLSVPSPILLAVTSKAELSQVGQDDLVKGASCAIDGKPILVFKWGVVTVKEKSYEPYFDHYKSPEEIKSAKLLEYPGKDGYGILEINEQKALVVYYEPGDKRFIRLYDPKKDPA